MFGVFLDQRKKAKMPCIQDPNQRTVGNLEVSIVDISGTKRKNFWKIKFMKLKITVRLKISETCREA
jgi:hypothetical protein